MEAPQGGADAAEGPGPGDFAVRLLAAGKRAGLSFVEMSELRVRDLLAFIDAYLPAAASNPRVATQADIDKLLA